MAAQLSLLRSQRRLSHKRTLTTLRRVAAVCPLLIFLLFVAFHRKEHDSKLGFHQVDDKGLLDEDIRKAVEKVVVNAGDGKGGRRRVVLVTAVNYAFREYLLNFNCSLRRSGFMAAPLVVALDEKMADFAKERGFETLEMKGRGIGGEVTFGSEGFNLLSKEKLYVVYRVLGVGVDVLFSDVDVVFCGGVMGELVRRIHGGDEGVEMLMQTAWPRSVLNSGFYYVKAGSSSREVFRAFLRYSGGADNDQVIVNRVMCRSNGGGKMMFDRSNVRVHEGAKHRVMPVGCKWNDKVEARILDGVRFPTGGELIGGEKLFHLSRRKIRNMCSSGQVWILHNNCILAEKKKARFIVKGLWYVDAEEKCLNMPEEASLKMRKRCGGSKCGPEGDLHRFPGLEMGP